MAETVTARARVRRHPERGVYERSEIYAIVDEALYSHVGFAVDGRPIVIPTIHARVGDTLYLHGSPASRMLRRVTVEPEVCVTVTLLDGLVLARSVYHHSMNYRSAVLFGRSRAVDAKEEKREALAAIVEHLVPGRSADARAPSPKELAGTAVVAVEIQDASAKIRRGPPHDFDGDLELPVWAGVIPLQLVAHAPEPDEASAAVAAPPYAVDYDESRR